MSPSPASLLLLVDVLMPDDLVGDPVEHVEDEEGQGEGRPGDGVYPLGSVHKLLPHGVHVSGRGRRRRRLRFGGRGGVFHGRAVLRGRRLTHVVAGKVEAAFAYVFILTGRDIRRQENTWNTLTWLLVESIVPSSQFSVSSVDVDSVLTPLTRHPSLPI